MRRLSDYHRGIELLDDIKKIKDFEKLSKMYTNNNKFPYNTMILVSIIQTAKKFGTIHGCNVLKGKPTAQQVELAKEKDAAWIMGLDTYYFLMPGSWKIWSDTKLNMKAMTIQELDPNVVLSHFNLKPEQTPLFACLIGDLKSNRRVSKQINDFFGTKAPFLNAAKFLNRIGTDRPIEEIIQDVIDKIFGVKAEPYINKEFLKVLKSFEINNEYETNVDKDILMAVSNDFVSIAEEILTNQPIFINPSFLDLRSTDMKTINELTIPFIQKTAGVLLKNLNDLEPRVLMMMDRHNGDFIKYPIEVIFPDFPVPSLNELIAGGIPEATKMDLLSYISDMDIKIDSIKNISEEYLADCVILMYLMKNQSLKYIDARCILKTLVDARRRSVRLDISTEYPKEIDERAYRVCFLYSKMYFLFQSCLSSIGLKNLCPEILFDGVWFQKIYALNQESEDDAEPEFNQAEIFHEFATLILN